MPSLLALMALVCGGGLGCGEARDMVLEPGEPPSRIPDGAVIARVGEGEITDQDFAEAASRQPKAAEGFDLDARRDVLEQLITDEILFQEATERGLYHDAKVRKIMVSLLIREEVFDRIRNEDIEEDELRAYFDEHRDAFIVPEKAQVRRIFVQTGDERTLEEAKSIMDDVRRQVKRDPAQFGQLAERLSEDPFKHRQGDVGLITREGKPGLPAEVVDKAFALAPGQISEIFEAGGGLNLVLTVSKRDRLERSFEQMKGSVMRRMKNERFQEMTEDYIAEVRQRYNVDIDDLVLANTQVQVQAAPPNVNARELLDVTKPREGMPAVNADGAPIRQ